MLPKWQDIRSAKQDILFRLGKSSVAALETRYSWLQKLEYWAGAVGLHIALITGAVMWFFEWFLSHASYEIVKYAQWIHGWEAILAVAVVVILHSYFKIIRPATVSFSVR